LKRENIQRTAVLAMFTAIIIGLQYLGAFIRFGKFSISAVLVPIVIGAVMYGPAAGAYLGGIFGLSVFMTGDAADFFVVNVPGTIITVMLKGILAGLAAGLIYKAFEKRSKFAAAVSAAVTCPIVNTGVFLIGCRAFFWETLKGWGQALGYDGVFIFIVVGLIGFNFLFELLLNVILSPAIARIIDIGKKKFS